MGWDKYKDSGDKVIAQTTMGKESKEWHKSDHAYMSALPSE